MIILTENHDILDLKSIITKASLDEAKAVVEEILLDLIKGENHRSFATTTVL